MGKRVLIISHLAINDTNNVGKTLYQLFQLFDKADLSQIYFNSIPPNKDICRSWYRITDDEVVNSYLNKRAGEEYFYVDGNRENDRVRSNLYRKSQGKTTGRLLLRDIVWKFARIDWRKLYSWLDKVNPEIVFLAPGYSVFAYRIALNISRARNIPIVFFSMDDYFNDKKSKYNVLEYIRITWLRNIIRRTLRVSARVITVSQEMADDYNICFGIKADVVYTPYETKKTYPQQVDIKINDNLKFIYAGSLGLDRWKIIYEIGSFLERSHKGSIILVYASLEYKELINKLITIESIKYGGFISSQDLQNKIKDADVVVHVESLEEKKLLRTRYSISTKIPECLASNKIFLAIGPESQASISYLKKNKAALVCSSIEEMQEKIDSIFEGKIDYEFYQVNAQKLICKNHNPKLIYNYMKKTFEEIL